MSEMEEKDSTVSGSPGGNSESESLPPVSSAGGEMPPPPPPVMNVPVNLNSHDESLATVVAGSVESVGKRKRGRPRKYDADGNLRVPYYTSPKSASGFSSKKARGRPPGSGNWQLLAPLGGLFAKTAGGDFTPHVVTVNAGEDVAVKMDSFFQKGPRGICVLSANGAISSFTIHQPGFSGGTLTYEGRFEILSLTGSYTVSENAAHGGRTGGLSVSLAGPDGRVIGGAIAGSLVAASPIQIVFGSFLPNGYQTHKRKHQCDPRAATTPGSTSDTVTAAAPVSQAAPDANIHVTPTSQLPVQNHGAAADHSTTDTQIPSSSSPASENPNGLQPVPAEKHHPDMSESLPVE